MKIKFKERNDDLFMLKMINIMPEYSCSYGIKMSYNDRPIPLEYSINNEDILEFANKYCKNRNIKELRFQGDSLRNRSIAWFTDNKVSCKRIIDILNSDNSSRKLLKELKEKNSFNLFHLRFYYTNIDNEDKLKIITLEKELIKNNEVLIVGIGLFYPNSFNFEDSYYIFRAISN